MTRYEPRFARIAALIADPTRAQMLACLLGGEYRSAGELARTAGIAPQSASTHLAQLLAHGLLSCRQQGRHKYFALADADVAHALEALSMVAERDAVNERWMRPGLKSMKCARRCYGHMAGELGVAQLRTMLQSKYLEENTFAGGRGWQLSISGQQWLHSLGAPEIKPSARMAYPCMDWSERQDHMAGDLARTLLSTYLQRKWLREAQHSRALTVTPLGRQYLLPLLQVSDGISLDQ